MMLAQEPCKVQVFQMERAIRRHSAPSPLMIMAK